MSCVHMCCDVMRVMLCCAVLWHAAVAHETCCFSRLVSCSPSQALRLMELCSRLTACSCSHSWGWTGQRTQSRFLWLLTVGCCGMLFSSVACRCQGECCLSKCVLCRYLASSWCPHHMLTVVLCGVLVVFGVVWLPVNLMCCCASEPPMCCCAGGRLRGSSPASRPPHACWTSSGAWGAAVW